MSQSGSQQHSNSAKTSNRPRRCRPTKQSILEWVARLLQVPADELKVEEMGDGVAYCRIINLYKANSVPHYRLILEPANNYEVTLNLKLVQIALAKMHIDIPVDIHELAKKSFTHNWSFLQQLHRHLACPETLADTSKLEGRQASNHSSPEKVGRSEKKSKEKLEVKEPKMMEIRQVGSPVGGLLALIDRAKEILLRDTHDHEKLTQIRWLMGLEQVVKEEEYLID